MESTQPLEQLEALAFGEEEERERALASLIPGTEDYYFHHCLQRQLAGRLAEVPALLEQWIRRHGRTERAEGIERRQALLTYERDPKAALEHLRQWLGLRFDHQREVEVEQERHPNALDQAAISRAALMARARSRTSSNLSPFEDSALAWLGDELTTSQRQHFLDRIARPDHPRLVAWVVEDLDNPKTGSFGSRRIHALLLKEQLDELLRQRPALLEQPAFVFARLAKLAPTADADADHDPAERADWLERLWDFVKGLEASFNALKVTVLHHRLAFERSRGIYNRARFLAYLRLPRSVQYAPADFLKRHTSEVVALGTDFSAQLGLPPVFDDEPLVRAFVERFVLADPSIEDFASYVRKDVLIRWRAFALIGAGLGDQERWYAELDDPAGYQSYQERVDIELLPENPVWFGADDPVRLAVAVKNVRDLVVKVFEINTRNYFLQHGREVDASIDLDGLEPGEERTLTLDESPLRIVRHEIDLPALAGPGVFVVELIGNGKSSRALIRKGTLRVVERLGAAGHVFNVLDERNQLLPGASIWLGGKEHRADAGGEIGIPYSTRPETRRMLLSSGKITTMETFHHRAERYGLVAGFYVDREQLLQDGTAELVVRAALHLGDVEVSLDLLEEVRLTIGSVDGEGTKSSLDVPAFRLQSDREAVHRFQVPKNLRALDFTLRAKVQSISEQRKVDLEAHHHVDLNQIDAGDRTHDLHLARTDTGHVLYLYGKTGEPLANKAIAVSLKHEDFVETVDVVLQTGADGRIVLGPLDGVASLTAQSPGGVAESFSLSAGFVSRPAAVHACLEETIRLPFAGGGFSLLETRARSFQRRCTDAVRVEHGQLVIAGLEPGDYDLFLAERQESIAIRVTRGRRQRGWAVSDKRQLEARPRARLAIDRVSAADDAVEIRLAAFSESTRVHLFATRFLPAYSAFEALGRVRDPAPRVVEIARGLSSYVSGRDIGDEYRYILERKHRRKFPGNMLARPGLLLNPWSVQKTDTGVLMAAGGGAYGASADRRTRDEPAKRPPRPQPSSGPGGFSSLDFLDRAAVVEVNLRPDASGVIKVDRALVTGTSLLRIVAVDEGMTIEAELPLPEAPHTSRDLRLLTPLDPKRRFTQKKERTTLVEGGRIVIEDLTTAEIEPIDTLAKAYGVLAALTSDAALVEFSFVLEWHALDEIARRKRYSDYACHELNLFLERKDPAFFHAVVKPYLANKKDKTFLDHYLLGESLDRYLEPWAYGRLNTLERILLGRRIDGESGPTRRHVLDRFELLEKNVEEDDRLFRSMLSKSALDTSDALGVAQAKAMMVSEGFAPMSAAAPAPKMRAAKKAKAPQELSDDFEMEKAALDEGGDDFDLDLEMSKEERRSDEGRRREQRPHFRQLSKTEEWAENNYWHRRIQEQDGGLIPVNGFWKDFAEHDGKGPFLSAHFAEATSCFAEMMCALAVLDLPFAAADHEVAYQGARMEMTARSSALVLSREIKPAPVAEKTSPILVSQNYFRKDDRYEYADGERRDRYVIGELLIGVPYICQVVLTNPTSSQAKLDVLLQIPEGAMPLDGGFFTRGRPLLLAPFSTQSIEYAFYFPRPGSFVHYPVQVAKNEEVVASAPVCAPLSVVLEPTEIDTRSWSWVSQHGSTEEVLRFLEDQNVERIDLSRIAWRMRDRLVFEKVTKLLSRRHRYEDVLWSYAHSHRLPEQIGEHLRHQDDFLRSCGPAFESPLVVVDPVARAWYEHLEYLPLVNARAHRLGGRIKILNPAFERQYRALLDLLCHRRAQAADLLAAAYYLFLQDRVEEALECFERVDATRVPTAMQHDYLTAYASLYQGDAARARSIGSAYLSHPVDRWRRLFEGILAVLDEAEDETARVVDAEDRGQEQARLAATEPSFELSVQGPTITIGYRNLDECLINYYGMDIELLFSRQPFVQQDSSRFSMIRPGRVDRIALPAGGREVTVPLPAELAKKNVVIEVVAGAQKRATANYAHELAVQLAEQYGHLYVRRRGTHAALPESYVKVYAKTHDGRVKFYKDGYTDVRGCFDYASLSTDELDGVERFAILVITAEAGAVIREAIPPQR